jgi:hypothetical protein
MRPGRRIQLLRESATHLEEIRVWTEIDLILSQFGFQTTERWSGSQYDYIVEMLSKGSDGDLLELHRYLTGDDATDLETSVDVWSDGTFRLFLTHVDAQKRHCSELKEALQDYGITAFVAHEDIQPTRQWMDELERALATCHALAAVLHEGFLESKWTDQEVGFCHGRGKLIVPIKVDLDPYGFISRYQAVNGRGKSADEVAADLFEILVRNEKTSAEMAAALVHSLAHSRSFAESKRRAGRLSEIKTWTQDLLRELADAPEHNNQVADSWGVPHRIKTILKTNGYAQDADEVDSGLPF